MRCDASRRWPANEGLRDLPEPPPGPKLARGDGVRPGAALAALVGESQGMHRARRLITRYAATDLPVLVWGPSGSGKELAARALHELGPRSDAPLVVESCAALPDSLVEAELFGHEKGAYTGATADSPGLFERANGGTLFLDEIGEVSLEVQAKLLRVIETGEVRRIGGSRVRRLDFRIITATNRDLEDRVLTGEFRADLYFRLAAAEIRMPALAERPEDIAPLAEHFLRLEALRTGTGREFAPEVLRGLEERSWPGNVRELANEISRLCVLSDGDLVDPELLRDAVDIGPRASIEPVRPLVVIEREAIENALLATGGNRARAAELLGISRAKIFQRLKSWRNDAPEES